MHSRCFKTPTFWVVGLIACTACMVRLTARADDKKSGAGKSFRETPFEKKSAGKKSVKAGPVKAGTVESAPGKSAGSASPAAPAPAPASAVTETSQATALVRNLDDPAFARYVDLSMLVSVCPEIVTSCVDVGLRDFNFDEDFEC